MLQPRIVTIKEKLIVGQKMTMSLSNNRTGPLWSGFMPRRGEIRNKVGSELYSIEMYTSTYFNNFNPNAEFEKWAAIEVDEYDEIPHGMEKFVISGGLYAVFLHKGPDSAGPKTFHYIFETWLPNSGFILDQRPHFEVMGEKYKRDDPNSEEEFWIPIKQKT